MIGTSYTGYTVTCNLSSSVAKQGRAGTSGRFKEKRQAEMTLVITHEKHIQSRCTRNRHWLRHSVQSPHPDGRTEGSKQGDKVGQVSELGGHAVRRALLLGLQEQEVVHHPCPHVHLLTHITCQNTSNQSRERPSTL